MISIYHRWAAYWKERHLDATREAKRALRRRILLRREAIGTRERGESSSRISARLAALDPFGEAATVLAYASFGSEPTTDALLEGVLAAGKTLVLPRVEGNVLGLYRVEDPRSGLAPGTWGIREPRPEVCERADPEDVDLVVVPGIAFDGEGGRLGYGGGYYDRLIDGMSRRPALVAGAFEVQIVERVPPEDHDLRVDLVVTEGRVLGPGCDAAEP